ncbi:class I mannose-6-phosphate isomerase [Pinibacter aurantiacus]|uniref:Class I mannose-6-phosphate isomerase n=1 Tax=Pinibacter aurantiacus TaxID=2851599 RepID=A0A9E2SFZ6_9BACT|nr:class I mannose-6-phosphate isomerase [Pinibacter aurantiacus]MBV4359695.1 class I mannose-6-phosphate isomerase [Pinibacter aurantiacus]
MMTCRKTTQSLMPAVTKDVKQLNAGKYDIYPFASLGEGKINNGYRSLAQWIKNQSAVAIDGYIGNDWNGVRSELDEILSKEGLAINWIRTTDLLKTESEIEQLVKPFIGEKGEVWGRRASISLEDFFDSEKLSKNHLKQNAINISIGVGASLVNKDVPVIYIDLPKNELQYRMRAEKANNLGKQHRDDNQETYKRFYFVDWVVLNEYKSKILPSIDIIVDGQWTENISWAFFRNIREGLHYLSQNAFRVRPWFEAGAWGGQWMKENINGLNKDEINYAWSFEMIVPENGLVFESSGNLLEIAFDWLMMLQAKEVLGADESRFGIEFPIRFDFLDTFEGGNLSIQCHPRLKYIQDNFGETITQDETYYILDCKSDAKVYLGFQETIDPATFRKALEESVEKNEAIDIEKYVQKHDAHKHDLFLIPNGTIHSSGKNNLVLEISATPYIFTFKMYDWVRLDLNGKPRPINIEHAFKNLDFSRKGKKVQEELISKEAVIEKGDDWQIVHQPTHSEHFYDVHRLEFSGSMEVETNDKCHILMLVEGSSIIVETKNGFKTRYNYAETFAVPAAAGSYKITNESGDKAKVVKAFVK